MPERRIRFGVRDDNGHRASTWTLALRISRDRPEVYLCSRQLGGVLKTSLHAHGTWRHAYVKERFNDLFEGIQNAPEDRCIEEWVRPAECALGVTWALRILVPPYGARTAIEPGLDGIHWIRIAPAPRWVETDIFLLAPTHAPVRPAPTATDFGVIATEPLGNGESVHVIHQAIDPPLLEQTPSGQLRFFAGRDKGDVSKAENLRTLVFAADSRAARVLIDAPIEISPAARERLATQLG